MRNSITFRLWGKNAMFSDPITKLGGELCTYQVPTYEAIKGIVEAIYWKPTIEWYIDRIKVVKPIQTESKNIKLREVNCNEVSLHRYTYLCDVEYVVEAHFEWNLARPDLVNDRDENKHHNIAKRYLSRGGKRDIFIGKRECVGFVEACDFDSIPSFYDDRKEIDFGIMFHSFIYPTKDDEMLRANLARITMRQGVIEFDRPDNPRLLRRDVKEMPYREVATADDAMDRSVIEEGIV